ncbi:MAG: hypothetical protein RIQ89_2396 [Bacteroidota bacterium]|jgi:periplasmic protein TonB
MALLNNWNDATNHERVELVFENRNKNYGAYVIRSKYNHRIVMAMVYSLTTVALAVGIPVLINKINESAANDKVVITTPVELSEPPPVDKTTPPPPPVEPPPPVQKTIQFTPPKVVKDEELEEPPPTQEEIKETTVSTVTQEGEEIVDLPPENPVVADPDEGKVFLVVEEMPEFPGGQEKMYDYIYKNFKYPAMARENGIQGRVYVTFVVDKDGDVKDAKVARGIGGGCDEEALRVIKSMPNWKPGKQNGRNVMVQYSIPINLTLK